MSVWMLFCIQNEKCRSLCVSRYIPACKVQRLYEEIQFGLERTLMQIPVAQLLFTQTHVDCISGSRLVSMQSQNGVLEKMATQSLLQLCHTTVCTTVCQRQNVHGPTFSTFVSDPSCFLSMPSSQRPIGTPLYLNKCAYYSSQKGRMHTMDNHGVSQQEAVRKDLLQNLFD